MQMIYELIKTNEFLLILSIIVMFLLIFSIVLMIKLINLSKNYNKFIKKINNGKTIQEDLENFMYKIDRVERQNGENIVMIQNLEKDLAKCIQKIGVVRYSAFKDTGSDLSFALALLDEENNGVVLNGIYSREISNIYAKPVNAGKSEYTLSKEEKEAIEKAKFSNNVYKEKM